MFDFGTRMDEARRRFTLTDVLSGWERFTDLWFMLDMLVVLLLAVGLGAAIAYHPLTRRKATTMEELEQPKIFIMYAMVGAVIGLIVPIYPVMGAVLFGIGGLLRFRTDVGPAKDTGRVILAVITGVACGLKLIPVAIMATAFGWAIMWYLEKQDYGRVKIQGLDRDTMARAAEAYRKVLTDADCKVLGEERNFTKGSVSIVFTSRKGLDPDALQRQALAVPADIRGAPDWDIS